MTAAVTTDQPLIDGGVASVNWFNGRLVTGEDLTREQQAGRAHPAPARAGWSAPASRAVSRCPAASASNARPVIRIEPGLAVNRQGHVLELATATEVALDPGPSRRQYDRADLPRLHPASSPAPTRREPASTC